MKMGSDWPVMAIIHSLMVDNLNLPRFPYHQDDKICSSEMGSETLPNLRARTPSLSGYCSQCAG